MFTEPSRTEYDLHFSLGNVPVRIHPTFWLFSALLGSSSMNDSLTMIVWVLACFICILFHELGHALAFKAYGSSPHIVLYGGGGLAIAPAWWRRHVTADVTIALAGPAAGFLLAAAEIVGLRLSGEPASIFFTWPGILDYHVPPLASRSLAYLVHFSLFLNLTWGLVNLLPVFPLDGGQAARALLVHHFPREGVRYSAQLSIGVALAAVAYGLSHQDYFLVLLFGYLAYLSYQSLSPWTGGGSRPW